MDRVLLEQLLSDGLSLAEIGKRVGRHESTVSYWLDRYGLEAVNRGKHRARGSLTRSRLEALVAKGLSVRRIAATLDRSPATIRHWLERYGLQTAARLGRPARAEVREALKQGLAVAMLDCPRHGRTSFQRRRSGGYRCVKCRSEAVTRRRRRVKRTLVEEAGGACTACGYDRCLAALHFHHVDPSEKRFMLSHRGVTRSLERARHEAKKCILLCGNCHAEVEAGLRTVPSKPPP